MFKSESSRVDDKTLKIFNFIPYIIIKAFHMYYIYRLIYHSSSKLKFNRCYKSSISDFHEIFSRQNFFVTFSMRILHTKLAMLSNV